jgi:hypothetical protein
MGMTVQRHPTIVTGSGSVTGQRSLTEQERTPADVSPAVGRFCSRRAFSTMDIKR